MRLKYFKLILSLLIITVFGFKPPNREIPDSRLYGMYEVSFESLGNETSFLSPQLSFYKPGGKEIRVDGFYDGVKTYKARAYCNEPGLWKWKLHQDANFKKKSGSFRVLSSKLKGKLKKDSVDPYQFAYDNGDWFLHIGGTGYRYLVNTEPKWKAYIDQAHKVGITKIRAWFCSSRSGVEALFNEERTALNLPYWQEMDKRMSYALKNYPNLIIELIPFGEDSKELKRYYAGDSLSIKMVRYAQARFSAYPDIYWCISNDKEIVNDSAALTGRQIYKKSIDKIGEDMAKREPWGTLITNHQSRYKGYSFVNSAWSDIITLEDVDQVDGRRILEYRYKGSDPIVLDEDRYEVYIKPDHPDYYFRRLMWASLLSGGFATYGGIETYIPYKPGSLQYGVQGYFDVGLTGANSFQNISKFFAETGLTLINMQPDDALTGNIPQKVKCIHNDSIYIIYLANPDKIAKPSAQLEKSEDIKLANESATIPSVKIKLPQLKFCFKWYDPSNGKWANSGNADGGVKKWTAPGGGDWILFLEQVK